MKSSHPELSCLCAALRRAERVLTRRYDQALQAVGLSSPQYGLLRTLQAMGPRTQQDLAQSLSLDKASLSRNLRRLTEEGLIEVLIGDDRRIKILSVTKKGQARLKQALPYWEGAQAEAEQKLGPEFALLRDLLNRLPSRIEA